MLFEINWMKMILIYYRKATNNWQTAILNQLQNNITKNV